MAKGVGMDPAAASTDVARSLSQAEQQGRQGILGGRGAQLFYAGVIPGFFDGVGQHQGAEQRRGQEVADGVVAHGEEDLGVLQSMIQGPLGREGPVVQIAGVGALEVVEGKVGGFAGAVAADVVDDPGQAGAAGRLGGGGLRRSGGGPGGGRRHLFQGGMVAGGQPPGADAKTAPPVAGVAVGQAADADEKALAAEGGRHGGSQAFGRFGGAEGVGAAVGVPAGEELQGAFGDVFLDAPGSAGAQRDVAGLKDGFAQRSRRATSVRTVPVAFQTSARLALSVATTAIVSWLGSRERTMTPD